MYSRNCYQLAHLLEHGHAKRDIFKDLSKLEKSYKGKTEDGNEFQIKDLEIFENVAYIMAYHADNSIPPTIEEWPDQFDMFSIYEVLPQILELLTIGLVLDLWTEKANDGVKYKRIAGQEDFDQI